DHGRRQRSPLSHEDVDNGAPRSHDSTLGRTPARQAPRTGRLLTLMPTALVLDGQSGPALSVTRSLGRAGWRVLAAEGTRSARSRYGHGCTLIDATQAGFRDSVGALTSGEPIAVIVPLPGGEPIDVIVPCTDASVAELWRDTSVLGGARILGGDRRSAEISLDK